MKISKEELVLFALHLLEEDERPNVKFSRDSLAYSLDISKNTLNLYFTKLKNSGYIIRHKRKYHDDIRQTVETTPEGRRMSEEIASRIEDEYLTPERHNINNIVKVSMVLNRIKDVLEKIFFLALFTQVIRFDLPLFLETIRTSKQDNNVVNILDEMDEKGEAGELPVVEIFFRSCLYGMKKDGEQLKDLQYSQDPNALLIIAEATTKQGRYSEARSVYEFLLSTKVPISQNQWMIARINLSILDSKEGRTEKALEDLQNLMDSTDNKIFISYIKQVMGRICSTSGDQDRALELYDEALHSFSRFGLPLLMAITHNNRGVAHYYMERSKEAEADWLRSKKYAKEADSRYVEAAVYNNLSDVELVRGNFEKSWKLCEMSHQRFSEVNDLEGIAWCDFQKAIYFLHRRDLENALLHYRRSETIAFPSPSPEERRFRRALFLEKSEVHGFTRDELDL